MDILRSINNIIRFFLEAALIILLLYFGLKRPNKIFLKISAGILLPAVLVFVWSVYMAPKSPASLTGVNRILTEILLFSSCLSVIALTGEKKTAIFLGIVTLINTILIHIL